MHAFNLQFGQKPDLTSKLYLLSYKQRGLQ